MALYGKQQTKGWRNGTRLLLTILVLAGIGLIYVYVSSRMRVRMPEVKPVDGVLDVREIPLDQEMYHLVNSWDYYPGKLYRPEDFADPDNMPEKSTAPDRDQHLGTHRLRILAKPNQYLSMASYSIDYSTRVFVNGQEVLNVGYVSEDPEETVRGGRYMTIPLFTGESGEVEIIYQYANFMHKDGGFIQATVIGAPVLVENYERGRALFSLFTGGGLLLFAFYFLLYSAYQRSREYGILSLCCVLIAFRNSHFVNQYLLPANFNFELNYRCFILTVSMLPTMAVYLPAAYFPHVISRKNERIFFSMNLVMIALHFLLPTEQLVLMCHISYYICSACAIVVLVRFLWYAFRKERFSRSDVVTLLIILLLFLVMLWEGINSGGNSVVAHFGMTPFALLIGILGLSVITNHKIQQRMEMLSEEQKKNAVLGQINAMNRDFLQTVAHELRTPLSVISGYAQLTEMQIEKGKLSPQTPERLHTIRSEADRLGAMVSNLMAYTYGEINEAELHMVDPKELLHNAALVAEPICEKQGNRLETVCETDCMLHGNFELLLQVLINLIVNASRHTENGSISVKVGDAGEKAEFYVSDTGSGIADEVAIHIFERGYTTDGGNGLGLAICSDTVRMHGGELELASTGPQGTTFRFTIPKEKNT